MLVTPVINQINPTLVSAAFDGLTVTVFGLRIQQPINEQWDHHCNFLVRLGIKQLHHNTLKKPGEKKILQGCNSIKHAPSSCQAYKRRRLLLDQVTKPQQSSISTNSLHNSMISTYICAQNNSPLEAPCYMDRTRVNVEPAGEHSDQEAY